MLQHSPHFEGCANEGVRFHLVPMSVRMLAHLEQSLFPHQLQPAYMPDFSALVKSVHIASEAGSEATYISKSFMLASIANIRRQHCC